MYYTDEEGCTLKIVPREIRGYVCVAMRKIEQNAIHLLFGKTVTQRLKAQDYESLATNGLKPFRTLKEALRVSLALEKVSDIESVWLGKIEMRILSQDELSDPDIQRATNLVVVELHGYYDFFDETILRGKTSESFPHAIPGSYLYENDLQPFDSFDSADYAAHEARRQAACPVALATFKLERITPP